VIEIRLGARAANAALSRFPQVLLAALLVACVGAAAVVARLSGTAQADAIGVRAGLFGVAIPVLAFVAAGRLSPKGPLAADLQWVVSLGGSRRRLLVGTGLGTLVHQVLVALVAACAAILLSGLYRQGIAQWVGTLGLAVEAVVAYMLYFWGIELLWPGSRLRLAALMGDWVFGALPGAAAACWPRAHVGFLAGGAAHLGLSNWGAVAMLWGLALFVLGVGFLHTRP
jgi:hypothetical protein